MIARRVGANRDKGRRFYVCGCKRESTQEENSPWAMFRMCVYVCACVCERERESCRTSVGGSSREKKPIKAGEIQKEKLSPIINELFMFEFVFITHCSVFSFILIHRRARPTISCLRDKTPSPTDIWERDSIDSSLVADQFRPKLAFFIPDTLWIDTLPFSSPLSLSLLADHDFK